MRSTKHQLMLGLLLAVLPAVARAESADSAKLLADRDAVQQKLDAIPADRLPADPQLKSLAAELVSIDRRLSGTEDDLLLTDDAVQQAVIHRTVLKVLSDRAVRDKSNLGELRRMAVESNAKKEVVDRADADTAAADAVLADVRSHPEKSADAYAKAIAAYESVAQQLKAALPPAVVPVPAPPPVTEKPAAVAPVAPPAISLKDIPHEGELYSPSDDQLRVAGPLLSGRRLSVRMVIKSMSPPGSAKGVTLLTTEDGKVTAIMRWDRCPAEIRRKFENRSTNRTAMAEGSPVDVVGVFTGLQNLQRCEFVPEDVTRP